jgi:putative hydrolase of the HAD superfamily
MIRHLLLDADGVVQDLPGGWRAAFEPFLGERSEAFVTELATDEQASLRGEPFLPVLAGRLELFGIDVPAADVYAAVWERIVADPAVLGLAERLRAGGLGIHLATNQNPERATYMRSELGYADRFDTQFYSCELGVAKPEAAYFDRVLAAVDAAAGEVLFVDDSARNVAGARAAGLAAEQWHLDDALPRLHDLLAAHGVH